MEHEEAPGVASLLKGQALFPAGLFECGIERNCTRGPRWQPLVWMRVQTLAQFGYLRIGILRDLDRGRSDFRMCRCDLKQGFYVFCSEILGT